MDLRCTIDILPSGLVRFAMCSVTVKTLAAYCGGVGRFHHDYYILIRPEHSLSSPLYRGQKCV